MNDKHLVIVGGGLAGLAAGCYARSSGYDTTIVEHNLALGGVCTAWPRAPYVVDGCIHWLTGGAFTRLYEELGIVPQVPLRTIETWLEWRDRQTETSVSITRDLGRLAQDLMRLTTSRADQDEIERVMRGAKHVASLDPGADRAAEITPLRDQLRSLWEMRDKLGELVHFRKPVREWARGHLESERLQRFFTHAMPAEAPALMMLMVLGYLQRGWLSRPLGGTTAFRDALIAEYARLEGKSILHATVDEIIVEGSRACGVRLDDGRIIRADAVLSTSSMPETVLRLLGGRFDAAATNERMHDWKMFQPIVLASFGVDIPMTGLPGMMFIDGLRPYTIGGFENDHLYLRVCNDDPALAPAGHAVVQAMLSTDYEWWATRGSGYEQAKDDVTHVALAEIERVFPGISAHVRMTDIATPLTYWQKTRSWRGAYEGWIPNAASLFGHVKKKLSGLDGLYMAGQWVEPGGGVPTAVMSGRQAVQILCEDDSRTFHSPRKA